MNFAHQHFHLCFLTIILHILQNVQADSFLTDPIIFGDFLKVGADKSDRQYEDLSVIEKVQQALGDVSQIAFEESTKNFDLRRFWGLLKLLGGIR